MVIPFIIYISFMCMFCRLLFVLLYFFFWPLCCLFDIQILITSLWYLQTLLVHFCFARMQHFSYNREEDTFNNTIVYIYSNYIEMKNEVGQPGQRLLTAAEKILSVE